jgi:hypothetical protein
MLLMEMVILCAFNGINIPGKVHSLYEFFTDFQTGKIKNSHPYRNKPNRNAGYFVIQKPDPLC